MKSEKRPGKTLTQLRREVLARGYDRHPSLLYTISDLPAELQSPALTNLVGNKALETSFAFPAQIHHGWKYVPKQALLFTSAYVIHLLASIWPDQPPQITSINRSELLYIKGLIIITIWVTGNRHTGSRHTHPDQHRIQYRCLVSNLATAGEISSVDPSHSRYAS
jgi:hypothetical protein